MHFVKDLVYICNAATPAVHADKSIPDTDICLKSVCDHVSMSLLSFSRAVALPEHAVRMLMHVILFG
jgi:hypothetical protein